MSCCPYCHNCCHFCHGLCRHHRYRIPLPPIPLSLSLWLRHLIDRSNWSIDLTNKQRLKLFNIHQFIRQKIFQNNFVFRFHCPVITPQFHLIRSSALVTNTYNVISYLLQFVSISISIWSVGQMEVLRANKTIQWVWQSLDCRLISLFSSG